MTPRRRDPVKEHKESAVYALLFFFLGVFAIKIVFGNLSGSKALLVSGTFELFGIFLSAITLLRIQSTAKTKNKIGSDFSHGKLEFLVAAGISLLIAIATGTFLFTIVHLVFFHTLYPPGMLGAWVAAILAAVNLVAAHYLKKEISEFEEADERRLRFLFDKDFILSILVVVVVIVSRSGFVILDYIFAVLEAIFIIAYSISFLGQSCKGLMDAPLEGKSLSVITACIQEAVPGLKLSNLKVNLEGGILEIMATVDMGDAMTVREARAAIAKIEQSLKEGVSVPHRVHIGFAEAETRDAQGAKPPTVTGSSCDASKDCAQCSEGILKWTIISNFFIAFLKILGSILSGSMGLLADSAESLGCTTASCAILYSIRISKKDRTVEFPFGYGKLEFIVALVVYGILFGVGLFISISSGILMFTHRDVGPDLKGLPLALLVILITFVLYRYNLCAGRRLNSQGLIVNAYNAKADMLTTAAVVFGIILAQLGPAFVVFDSVAAFLVGLFIMKDGMVHWASTLEWILDKEHLTDYREKVSAAISKVFSGPAQLLKPKRIGRKFWIGLALTLPEDASMQAFGDIQKKIRDHLVEEVNSIEEVDFFLASTSV